MMKRTLFSFVAALAVATCVLFAAPTTAFADDLTVWVGYPGGPYYQKAHYSDANLWAMSDGYTYEYSTFDSGGFLRKGYGQGVRLDAVFNAAGVNPWSLTRFYFGTDDGYVADDGAYGYGTEAWSYGELTGTKYYFSGYPEYYDFDWNLTAEQESQLWGTASQVPAIIALTSSFNRVSTPDDPYWHTPQLGTQSGNRLMFGQASPRSADARMSAHSVSSITCIMGGVPEINLGAPSIEGKVGDSFTVMPSLVANDILVSQLGVKDIRWSSGNEEVATVVQNGDGSVTITIVGEGNVMINASFGNSPSADFIARQGIGVSGTGTGDGSGDGDGGGDGSGDGDGDGLGDGDGSDDGDGDGDGGEGTDKDGDSDTSGGSGSGDGDRDGDEGGDSDAQAGGGTIEVSHQNPTDGQNQSAATAKDQTAGEEIETDIIAAIAVSLPLGARLIRLNVLTDMVAALSGGGKEGGGGGGGGGGGQVIQLGGLMVTAVRESQLMLFLMVMGVCLAIGGIKRVGSFELAKDRYARHKAKMAQQS